MAKAKKSSGVFDITRIGTLLNDIAKDTQIIVESNDKPLSFISTGCYIVDAALSSNLLNGGIAYNRITAFAGEPGAGKSFFAYSTVKNAQKLGYYIIYIDTERSIELDGLKKLGIQITPDKLQLVRIGVVEDVSKTIVQLLNPMLEAKKSGLEIPKIMFVLDSLGQMASTKEKDDLFKGENKQDMTKAKANTQLFRVINNDLGYLEIPLIVCNHTYKTMDMFPQEVLRGGNGLLYSASVIGFLSKSKLKDGTEGDDDLGSSGIKVTFKTQKNRLAKPKKVYAEISFKNGLNKYAGLEYFCTAENYATVGIYKGKRPDAENGGVLKEGGNFWYVRHLDKMIPTKQLFNSVVFTQDVLKALDPIVHKHFAFRDESEMEDEINAFNALAGGDMEELLDDDIDADTFFDN